LLLITIALLCYIYFLLVSDCSFTYLSFFIILFCIFILLCVVDVEGVTQLGDVVYMVCAGSSSIVRFNATTHQRLTDINVKGLSAPSDIAACQQTSQLYIPDYHGECIWRVSEDGADIKRWWSQSSSDTFEPWKLSVTATRVLVTPLRAKQLMQLDTDGNELRRVQLPPDMEPCHAVESPTGTFIVSHDNTQRSTQGQVSEVQTDGKVLRQFRGSRLSPLGLIEHVAIDSHANIFLADADNSCIQLLDAQLKLRRVILDDCQLNYKWPYRLCYTERTGQLLVAFTRGKRIAVFNVLRR